MPDLFLISARWWKHGGILSWIFHFPNGSFVDTSVNQSPVRAWCDAVEIAGMSEGPFPDERNAHQPTCRKTRLIMVWLRWISLGDFGSSVAAPYGSAQELTGQKLIQWLEQFQWNGDVWHAGHCIDCLTTAYYQNLKHWVIKPDLNAYSDWIHILTRNRTGNRDRLDCVNGFTASPEEAMPSSGALFQTAKRPLIRFLSTTYLFEEKRTSCNVLDVIHPLWLCRNRQFCSTEGMEWAVQWIDPDLKNWDTGKGFLSTCCFDNLTLMGTEMWLSILYLLCDYVGLADCYLPAPGRTPVKTIL